MISFSVYDIIALTIFFLFLITIGFYFGRNSKNDVEDFFLSSRQVGLVLFVMTNVATWYGGILGVGEFVFRYGLLSWTTQGLPYYIFALGFAFLFAKKIRETNIATLPDKIFFTYGQSTAAISGFFYFCFNFACSLSSYDCLFIRDNIWIKLLCCFTFSRDSF